MPHIAIKMDLKSLPKPSGSPPSGVNATPIDGSHIDDHKYAANL